MCGVKAAPADEARVVAHFEAPRGAGPRRSCNEDLAVDAKATPRSGESRTGQSKLTRANSWVILPDSPSRANGTGPGDQRGRSRRIGDAQHASSAHTQRRGTCCGRVHAFGPKPIDGAQTTRPTWTS